jgi:hypothetical protein
MCGNFRCTLPAIQSQCLDYSSVFFSKAGSSYTSSARESPRVIFSVAQLQVVLHEEQKSLRYNVNTVHLAALCWFLIFDDHRQSWEFRKIFWALLYLLPWMHGLLKSFRSKQRSRFTTGRVSTFNSGLCSLFSRTILGWMLIFITSSWIMTNVV